MECGLDSNRCTRLCRPVRSLSATAPKIHNYCNKLLYLYINSIPKDIKMNKNYFEIARKNMVTNQILPVGVKNKTLIKSFEYVRRELFITGGNDDLIYTDSDVKFNNDRNFIRSFLLAKMFEQCNFTKDDKILVIGCLTGYSVAILSNLVGYVFAIENDKKTVELANKTLYELNLLNCSVHYKSKLNHGNSKMSSTKYLLRVRSPYPYEHCESIKRKWKDLYSN